MDETVHNVSFLEDIDLYAKEANIAMSQCNKVFGIRKTKRFAIRASSSNVLAPLECDGPLSTVYKQVLNVEITQLLTEPRNSALRQTHLDAKLESGDAGSTSQQKLRVFFYDQYADCLQECLKGYDPSSHVLLLAFDKIPSLSVFPYAYHNWYEQLEMSELCFCLGGESAMRTKVNGKMVRPHFDSEDMSIIVAIGDKRTGDFHEYTIQKSTRPSEMVEEHSPIVSILFQAWQERWNMPLLGQQLAQNNIGGADVITAVGELTATAIERQRGAQPVIATTPRLRPASEPPAGQPHTKRPRSLTQYTQMKDLRPLLDLHLAVQGRKKFGGRNPCEANLYGVVLGFSAAMRTNGGDMMLNVTLLDESSLSSKDGDENGLAPISLLIFCRSRSQLPDLRRAGDILRLHRVVVQKYQEEVQLMAQRSTEFTVYRGSINATQFDPAAIFSSSNNSMSVGDETRFHSLRKWGSFCLANHSTIKGTQLRRLEQVLHQGDARTAASDTEQDLTGDFTVMVTAILPFPANLKTPMLPCGWLRVWDGTGVSDSDRYPLAALAPSQPNNDPPSQALTAISKIKESRDGRPQMNTPQRLCGRVVNVVIWETSHWDVLTKHNNLKIGDFVRLRNVKEIYLTEFFPRDVAIRCLHAQCKSWVTPLPADNFEVFDLLAAHSKRISRKHPPNPKSGVLPLDQSSPTGDSALTLSNAVARPPAITNFVGASYSSLRRFMGGRAGAHFVGNVRVKASFPAVSGTSDMGCLCQTVGGSDRRRYRFALSLNDGKRTVLAVVSDAVGAQLFGMPADLACGNRSDAAYESLSSSIRAQRLWEVGIRSTELNSEKYFFLTSISLC